MEQADAKEMTPDEKKRQDADLLYDHQMAENALRDLRERARRLALPFKRVDTWLQYLGSLDRKQTYGEDPSKLGNEILADPDGFRPKLDLDAVLSVAVEIRTTEETLRDLRARKDAARLR